MPLGSSCDNLGGLSSCYLAQHCAARSSYSLLPPALYHPVELRSCKQLPKRLSDCIHCKARAIVDDIDFIMLISYLLYLHLYLREDSRFFARIKRVRYILMDNCCKRLDFSCEAQHLHVLLEELGNAVLLEFL